MYEDDSAGQERRKPGHCISRLSAAILRINENIDFDCVLMAAWPGGCRMVRSATRSERVG